MSEISEQSMEEEGLSALGEWNADPAAPKTQEREFKTLNEFVEFVCRVFMRCVSDRLNQRRWQAEWFKNEEAVLRLTAMWRAYEHLKTDPGTGLSVWLQEHADYHLGVLWDADGPFAWSTDKNDRGEPLPFKPAPEGMFPDERGS